MELYKKTDRLHSKIWEMNHQLFEKVSAENLPHRFYYQVPSGVGKLHYELQKVF